MNNGVVVVVVSVAVSLSFLAGYIFLVKDYTFNGNHICSQGAAIGRTAGIKDSEDEYIRKLSQTRISLSKQLNKAQQQIGQLACQQQKGNHTAVTAEGGWCLEYSTRNSSTHAFDVKLCAAIARFLTSKKVASFGDGPGFFKEMMDKLGLVTSYDAYDGAPFSEKASQGLVHFLDLTIPQYGLPLYDWVVSLEVAEHIPAQYETIYVDNIVRHAREGVILSWAVPGQPGFYHVNNKALKDVISIMDNQGFTVDEEASKGLRNASTYWWYQRNVYVYRRKPSSSPDVREL